MESILYAEVYLICMIIVGLLLFWELRSESNSATDQWLKRVLVCFEVNFASNFCFTLFNGVRIYEPLWLEASYFFKTLYHISLVVGVFAWCGYAETENGSDLFETPKTRRLVHLPALLPIAAAVGNLWNHQLFYLTESGSYVRCVMFHVQMVLLLIVSAVFACRILRAARYESDPNKKSHMALISSFPLCILAAWILSFVGESVPVICVSITIELLCLYMGTSRQQISVDKLTQVNNRQNLIGFMKYKLKIHDGPLYLLMMDVDYFKKINDTYGHLEGDRALTTVSGVLKRACAPYKKRPYIARYGGDEFMIVLEATEAEVAGLCQSIHDMLRAASDGLEYTLKVSIGCARWIEGMGYKELIASADEELYKIKQARKA
ncbi:MAG: GGDEF domain-containing protein [Oscillospiraceae bacterium]|nr:GGDEF domain-containing protein [Oscillospiraceae bacterium]